MFFLPFIFSSSCFIQNYENIFKSRIYDSVLIQSDFTALCAKHRVYYIYVLILLGSTREVLWCAWKNRFWEKYFFFFFVAAVYVSVSEGFDVKKKLISWKIVHCLYIHDLPFLYLDIWELAATMLFLVITDYR